MRLFILLVSCPPLFQVNGTYELAGFRHRSPVYTKGREDVSAVNTRRHVLFSFFVFCCYFGCAT